MKKKNFKKLFGFTRLVKPFARFGFAFEPKAQSGSKTSQTKFRFAHSYGFTLAEVLITLSILGVVAAITVPSLIDRQNEKEFVTKLKKEYAALTNAYDIAQAEMGTDPASWYADTGKYVYEKIFERMNVTKTCASGDNSCANDSIVYKTLSGQNAIGSTSSLSFNRFGGNETVKIYVLKDGTKVNAYNYNTSCEESALGKVTYESKHRCAGIYMDLNGDKGPNKLGIDTFRFDITQHQIIPSYTAEYDAPLNAYCSKNSEIGSNGAGCTAWVIAKGNMDYKRKAISW